MAYPDYSDLTVALTRAKERSGSADDVLVTEILELTAGVDPLDVKVYRPFWAAAELLGSQRSVLEEGEGAKFREYSVAIERLEQLQMAIDTRLELTVPEQFTIEGRRYNPVGAIVTSIPTKAYY